jgi:NAD-reducing hydrogenase large subunit
VHNVKVIDPVTRIEGHAKISLHLDDDGQVTDARFHVTEFRGFEDFCRGRPYTEMPGLTARTCGICPVSHLLASAKAVDEIMAVRIPPAAERLRRLGNLGQIIQSHALSFFHLSAPDLLLGMDADPAGRNLFGLMQSQPDLVRRGIRLRKFGQEVIAAVTGRRIHGSWVVGGGMAEPLTEAARDGVLALIEEAKTAAADTIDLFVGILDRFEREVAAFGSFPSMYLAHHNPDGTWEHYGDRIRVVDAAGSVVESHIAPADYREFLGERSNGDTYLKSPYYKPLVTGDDIMTGMYRVGPLARLNICERMGTPGGDAALDEYRRRAGDIAQSSFFFHHARLIEVLTCVELIEELLRDPAITDTRVRAQGAVNATRGVGSSEAPRGTLFHDYTVDAQGLVTDVNMLIATGQNNLAMNRTINQIAREWITGPDIPEGVLNRLEAGIRSYDPCLSCSTHALGEMPFIVDVHGPDGALLGQVRRE